MLDILFSDSVLLNATSSFVPFEEQRVGVEVHNGWTRIASNKGNWFMFLVVIGVSLFVFQCVKAFNAMKTKEMERIERETDKALSKKEKSNDALLKSIEREQIALNNLIKESEKLDSRRQEDLKDLLFQHESSKLKEFNRNKKHKHSNN